MVDLHAHVLPGLDDGPQNEAEALALVRAAAAAGVEVLAATPHVNRRFDPSPTAIADAARAVRAGLESEATPLELVTGAEVAPSRLDDVDGATLSALSLGGGGCVLLECEPQDGDIERDVRRLRERGHEVLLAHAERCTAFREDPALVATLVQSGALVSVTAASFTGAFGAAAERLAFTLLEAGLVHDIASDAHDTVQRPPEFAAARRAVRRRLRGTDQWWTWLVRTAPAAVLEGGRPPESPPLPPVRRGALGRWLAR